MSFFKKAVTPKAATQSSMSQSGNNYADEISRDYVPQIQQGNQATNFIAQLLGMGGSDDQAQQGYQNYLQTAGFQPALTQLSKNITGQRAAAGMLDSGSTRKALLTEGGNLNNSFFNNYFQQLGQLGTFGQNAGGLVSNAGQFSKSSSEGQGGGPSALSNITKGIGQVGKIAGGVSSIFSSDRRLKVDIRKIDEADDGLGIYTFRYIWDRAREYTGVMADEVARLRPWALGPKNAGYATVDYGAL